MGFLGETELALISKFNLFRGLKNSCIQSALTGASMKQLKHRELLFRAGEDVCCFCIVLNGALKLIRPSPRGIDIIVHFAIQGDLIGALLMNQEEILQFPISAKSMGPSEVICIPKSTFSNFWKNNLDLMNRMNSILYQRMSTIQNDKMLFSSPLRNRIALLLLRHIEQVNGSTMQSLSLPLTRQEIADSLNVAVESVIRIMSEWTEEGIIHRPYEKGPEKINIAELIKKQ
jgi:CRP-like cAMP-binding protein